MKIAALAFLVEAIAVWVVEDLLIQAIGLTVSCVLWMLYTIYKLIIDDDRIGLGCGMLLTGMTAFASLIAWSRVV